MNASDVARIEAHGIALVRSGRLLFENLSFALAPGEALVVTGPNGAGKSSLLRVLAGLIDPTEGKLHNPLRTAFHAGEPALKPERTLGDELGFWGRLDAADPGALASAANAMGITELLDLPTALLSAGQRQRAALARVIASGARLWLLDEPLNALDSQSIDRLLLAIAAHRASSGLVVLVTHQPLALAGQTSLRLG